MKQVIYISRPSPELSAFGMKQIVSVSQRNNRRADLTGLLVFSGKQILQVLEGQEVPLAATLKRIADDSRHEAMKVLAEKKIVARRFGDWAMSYVYSLDLADELESLFTDVPSVDVDALLMRLEPDTMNGSL